MINTSAKSTGGTMRKEEMWKDAYEASIGLSLKGEHLVIGVRG